MLMSLEDWEEKLREDNDKCKVLARAISSPSVPGLSCDLSRIHTNMVSFTIDEAL